MDQLHGTLIVSAFVKSQATDLVYKSLMDSAARHGLDMDLKTNADYMSLLSCKGLSGLPEKNDFILFWNKDCDLGQALEAHGMRLFNPSSGIKLCDNKALTTKALAGRLNMPLTIKIPMTFDGVGYNETSFLTYIEDTLGYPFVIKECWGSYGDQVYLAKSRDEAARILKSIDGTECIAQQYISSSCGRDLRAYVVGGRVVACIERRNDHDFRANIAGGGSASCYNITKEQEEMAVSACRLLNLDFGGVDMMFLKDDAPILCEVNSNAQFAGLKSATGIDVTDAIFEHIISTVSTFSACL